MWIEDDELKIFCDLLSAAYIDHYIEPSIEWTSLPSKELEAEFERFKQKKSQTEKNLAGDLDKETWPRLLHFGSDPIEPLDSSMEKVFQAMTNFLGAESYIRNCLDLQKAYFALRWILEESGSYVPKSIQEKLEKVGLSIDSSRVTEWDKKHIVIQTTAQVIAFDHGYFNIRKIKEEILNFDYKKKVWFYLDQWKSTLEHDKHECLVEDKDRAKAIERLIASVNPIPASKRRGRPPLNPRTIKEIIFIPGIFIEDNKITKIQFCKLKIVIYYLAACLYIKGHSYDGIIEHPIFLKYCNRLPVFFHSLLEGWVKNALEITAEFF